LTKEGFGIQKQAAGGKNEIRTMFGDIQFL
jgi:hypothetical protein